MSGDELRGKYRDRGPDTDSARSEARSDDELPAPVCDYCGANHLNVPRCAELLESLREASPEFYNPWPGPPPMRMVALKNFGDDWPDLTEWTVYDEVVDWPYGAMTLDEWWAQYRREVELRAHLAERDRDAKFTDMTED